MPAAKAVPGAYPARRLPCAAQVVSSGGVGGQTEQPHRRDHQGIAGFSRLLTTDIRVYRGLVLSVLVVNERRGSGRENGGAGVVPLPEKGMGFAGDLVHDKIQAASPGWLSGCGRHVSNLFPQRDGEMGKEEIGDAVQDIEPVFLHATVCE